jgi:transposase InsO family protein
LVDRSSRPLSSPQRTPAAVEARVLEARRKWREGQDQLADKVGVPARTISRILRRHDMPYLRDCDPLTGEVIRASKKTTVRYERDRPGELLHVDVKKIGRIPPGGGWRAWGRAAVPRTRKTRIGFDYVHSAVDDHSRLAYSEIHADETGATAAGFLERAAAFFTAHGIDRIEAVMTDNHWSYTNSHAVRDILRNLGAKHIRIRPHCPWQNGKVERFHRTLQTEWAYRRIYRTNTERTRALAEWLTYYNHRREHSSLGRRPPISRLSTT